MVALCGVCFSIFPSGFIYHRVVVSFCRKVAVENKNLVWDTDQLQIAGLKLNYHHLLKSLWQTADTSKGRV